MEDLTIDLDHPAARLAANVGGKGASLARMRASGLPVPSGFVVSTQAFGHSGFTLPKELNERMAAIELTDMAALVAREYGIPVVILTRDATTVIANGQIISVDAEQGMVDLTPSA